MTERRAPFSFAHERRDAFGDTPLRQKTGALRETFGKEQSPLQAASNDDTGDARRKRRESFMVKRQKPQPVLRPSHRLAYETDRLVFNDSLRRDHDPY